jgi:hypothetical protein
MSSRPRCRPGGRELDAIIVRDELIEERIAHLIELHPGIFLGFEPMTLRMSLTVEKHFAPPKNKGGAWQIR